MARIEIALTDEEARSDRSRPRMEDTYEVEYSGITPSQLEAMEPEGTPPQEFLTRYRMNLPDGVENGVGINFVISGIGYYGRDPGASFTLIMPIAADTSLLERDERLIKYFQTAKEIRRVLSDRYRENAEFEFNGTTERVEGLFQGVGRRHYDRFYYQGYKEAAQLSKEVLSVLECNTDSPGFARYRGITRSEILSSQYPLLSWPASYTNERTKKGETLDKIHIDFAAEFDRNFFLDWQAVKD